MSATLSLSHLLGHVPRTPASVHPLPWDPVLQTLPARLLPRSCLVRGIPSKSFPSEPGSGTQAAKEAGSGFRGPPRDPKDGGGGETSRIRGLQDGVSPGWPRRPQHSSTRAARPWRGSTGFTAGRAPGGLATMPAEERGALAESCRSGRTSSPGLGNASPGQRGTVRRPTDTRRGTGWDGARQQVSALPLGTPRSQAAATPLTHLHRRSRCSDVALLHSSPVKEMNDHRRSGMGTQERAMGTLPL